MQFFKIEKYTTKLNLTWFSTISSVPTSSFWLYRHHSHHTRLSTGFTCLLQNYQWRALSSCWIFPQGSVQGNESSYIKCCNKYIKAQRNNWNKIDFFCQNYLCSTKPINRASRNRPSIVKSRMNQSSKYTGLGDMLTPCLPLSCSTGPEKDDIDKGGREKLNSHCSKNNHCRFLVLCTLPIPKVGLYLITGELALPFSVIQVTWSERTKTNRRIIIKNWTEACFVRRCMLLFMGYTDFFVRSEGCGESCKSQSRPSVYSQSLCTPSGTR